MVGEVVRKLAGVALLLLVALAGPALAQDETCLACHADRSLQSAKGRRLFVDPDKHAGSVHGPLGCTACHRTIREFPHPARIPRVDCSACHSEALADVSSSVHGLLGTDACLACHGTPHEIGRAAGISPQRCADCHSAAVEQYQSSIHAKFRAAGDAQSPTCQSCHGSAHKILSADDPASPVARGNLPDTCGACHANPEFLAQHPIPFARPIESYRRSVHGRAVAAGNEKAPACSDCHSSHAILPARDPNSKINHWNVPQTCGACHTEIASLYQQSVHGQAVARGVRDAPVCTDCHGEHLILAPGEPESLVSPTRISKVTCGRCHTDERLARRYNLPLDKVPAFEDSYHGLALRAGSQTVANCASCHGVHNILPSSDPRSTIHPANLAKTCGACHPGAGERFALGPVHVRPASPAEHPVVAFIRVTYWILIPLTVGFMLLHNLLDFLAKLARGHFIQRTGETLPRMNLHFRIAHWLTMLSFPVLVVTGFALKFPEQWWAQPLLRWEGKFALRGTIHRAAGVVLLASFFYHTVHLLVSRRDRIILRHLRPGIEDLKALWGVIRYNLGLEPVRPRFGKFSYAEKIEYWAFVWGTVVMAVSGFLLWFNNFTLRYFPKWVSDAATAVHYYEAILATLAILIWHFYMTIFDPDVYPMDMAWLTGKTSADHIRHTRSIEYIRALQQEAAREAEIAAPASPPDADPDTAKNPPAETERQEE
jgi:formate dehydrogenase gamma subunit